MPKKIDHMERRAQLAEAVWKVAREQGISQVSVRTVAAEAGVAVGSLRHIFPTRAELMQFSAELMWSRALARLQAMPQLDDPTEMAVAMLMHALPLNDEARTEFNVNLALIAEAPAIPGLAAVRDQAYMDILELMNQFLQHVAPHLPRSQRDDEARRLYALVDGISLHMLYGNGPSEDWARETLRREVMSLSARRLQN